MMLPLQFQNNRFDFVWPIKLLRWYAIIFFQVLQVAVFKLYLMALDCQVREGMTASWRCWIARWDYVVGSCRTARWDRVGTGCGSFLAVHAVPCSCLTGSNMVIP